MAIITGLQWAEEVRPDRVVLCTDSLAVLESLQTEKSVREDLIIEINQYLLGLQRGGIEVQFCWVPAHKGLTGNEGADKLAKKALQQQIELKIVLGKGEGKAMVKKKGMEIWQRRWDDDQKGRGYYQIQNSVNAKEYSEKSRRDERIITRLRLGHTGLNSTLFIMGKSETKTCGNCGELENVEHIILKCESYSEEREELCEKVREAGREWNIMGILGAEGKGVGLVRKALLKFLYDSRLSNRI